MNSIVNAMPKYDHRQHVLSDWLAELDQRFQLAEVRENANKITWCQLLIGATGCSILSSLDEEASWEDAKVALLSRIGIGSVRDEALAAPKNLRHSGARWRGRKTRQAAASSRRGSRRATCCRCLFGGIGSASHRRGPETGTQNNGGGCCHG